MNLVNAAIRSAKLMRIRQATDELLASGIFESLEGKHLTNYLYIFTGPLKSGGHAKLVRGYDYIYADVYKNKILDQVYSLEELEHPYSIEKSIPIFLDWMQDYITNPPVAEDEDEQADS